jgi:transcriptional regulator with XRE-family HTH domain
MTQDQLADRSGVSVSTIRRLENGKSTDPRLATVKLLADALPTTPEEHRALLSLAVDVDAPAAPPRGLFADASDELAHAVRARWQREEEQRGIHDPIPLPVRWQQAQAHLTDHWDSVNDVALGDSSSPLNLVGELTEIADFYRRIPSGRLVVLGRAGSGKTVLTLRFVLDFLRTRRSAEPVPVIFSLGSWDPRATSLRDWLVDRLLRDYPGLTESAPGSANLATALVDANLVLPVLDGFDEIADGLHRTALEALSRTSLTWLLTSRPDEYDKAVATTTRVLAKSAAVELMDLTSADLANYLPRTAGGAAWRPVLDEVRKRPGSPIAVVLSSPLMVMLARTVYGGQDPATLLDTTRFPTTKAVEDHLLGGFVPTVYRDERNWHPERVQRWFGHLARHLGERGTSDLAWWQLGDSLRRSSRILTVVVAASVVTTLFDWLVYTPLYMVQSGVALGLGQGLLEGVVVGPTVGLAFGLVHGLTIRYTGIVFAPSRVRVQLRGAGIGDGFLRKFAVRFGGGLLGGFVLGVGYASSGTLLRSVFGGIPPGTTAAEVLEVTVVNALVHGLVFGLAAGLVFGLAAALESPLDISTAANPVGLLATNRTTVVRQVLALAPMLMITITFGGGLVVTALQGLLGPLIWEPWGALAIGTVGGLTGALSYAFAFTAWGQWVILSRVWLPLTGKLPWSMVTFLDDAYRRGVLRQAGAVYQFRHARLQDHLSDG